MKKSLGQNFLIDVNIIKKIINKIDLTDKHVLEIGPGDGAHTNEIIKKKPKSLILIEKDNSFSTNLKSKHSNNEKIKIYNLDVLKFNFEEIIKKNTIILGNLPYNISSQILARIIKFSKWPPKYSDLVLMFQKEMADRIVGAFGTKNYGRISILRKYRLNIIDTFGVTPNCFFPKPKVFSTVIHFKPKIKQNVNIKDIKNLEKITNIFFSTKRKMINKNIRKIFNSDNKMKLIKNINLKNRPSELKPEKYYEITKLFEKLNSFY